MNKNKIRVKYIHIYSHIFFLVQQYVKMKYNVEVEEYVKQIIMIVKLINVVAIGVKVVIIVDGMKENCKY